MPTTRRPVQRLPVAPLDFDEDEFDELEPVTPRAPRAAPGPIQVRSTPAPDHLARFARELRRIAGGA